MSGTWQGTAGMVAVPGAFAAMGLVGLLLLQALRSRERHVDIRVRSARGEASAVRARVPRRRIAAVLGELGNRLVESDLLPARTVRELQDGLAAAGIAPGRALGLFIASKVLAAAALPGVAVLLAPHVTGSGLLRLGLVFGSFVSGLLAPDMVIRQRRAGYVRRLEVGLGDALDMLVICAEAGLALEPGLFRVANELAPVHPELAGELMRTVQELQVMSDSRTVLQAMGRRTGVAGMKRLGAAMIQSMHHGTPLIQVLQTLSVEMRQEMLLRYEERAARLPTLLTVPMIVFILPCVFLVVGGPAMVQVWHSFRH